MVEKFKAFVVDQDDNGIVSNSYKEQLKMTYLRVTF